MGTRQRYVFSLGPSACTHATYDRTSPYSRAPPALLIICPSASRVQNTPLPPLPPSATETGPQTHSRSFSSRYLLIAYRHPLGAVRARARYRQRSSWHTSLCRPSRPARESQITRQSNNGPAGAIAVQPMGKRAQGIIPARMSCARAA